MKEMQLTQGQTTKLDDEDFEYFSKWRWTVRLDPRSSKFYACRKYGKKYIHLHREIINTPSGMVCDHINHDTLDNQKHNLRNATYSQNMMNRKLQSNNQLREKNIRKLGKKYQIYVGINGKTVFRCYKTLEEAKQARDALIQFFHGDFGYIP